MVDFVSAQHSSRNQRYKLINYSVDIILSAFLLGFSGHVAFHLASTEINIVEELSVHYQNGFSLAW